MPGQQISVYELPGMGLLAKKSIKIDGVVDFEWCPLGEKDHEEVARALKQTGESGERKYTCVLGARGGQPTGQVSLMGIPSRAVLRSKNLFNVTEVCY